MAQIRKEFYFPRSFVGPGPHLHFVSQLARELAPAAGPGHASGGQLLGTLCLCYSWSTLGVVPLHNCRRESTSWWMVCWRPCTL